MAGGQGEGAAAGMDLEDGFYMAQEDAFSERTGWKYVVTLEVENGEIVSAQWDGAHREAGDPKDMQSRNGEYGMVENGGAIAPWYEQAEKTEQYLLKTQDPTDISYTNDAGNTDAISGVTIHVKEFFTLAQEALQAGPTEQGPYEYGGYTATADEFSHGWKTQVSLTVIGGHIISAYWTELPEEGDMDKRTASVEGEYGMVSQGDAQAPWYEQAEQVEQYLIETQDPTDVRINDEGKTDAISGVSVTVQGFFTLAQEALEGARR
jgi:major membrane immunogen (membrane-anchored lipoprotein)